MALIPPKFLDAVIAIGKGGGEGIEPIWIGTGFLYARPIVDSPDRIHMFMVTNRHIAEAAPNLTIALNISGQEPKLFRLRAENEKGKKLWIPHPDGKTDLAITHIEGKNLQEQGADLFAFHGVDATFRIDDFREQEICEGDRAYVLGYPLGVVAEGIMTPIARSAIIARVRDLKEGKADSFWIDANVFPGNSGGPVLLAPELTAITGTKSHRECRLIGVVQSFLPYVDEAVSRQTGRIRITFEDNSGLAPIIPVDRIEEVIDVWFDENPSAPRSAEK